MRGLGVAQRQYAKTGRRLDYRSLPSIILQAFIALNYREITVFISKDSTTVEIVGTSMVKIPYAFDG